MPHGKIVVFDLDETLGCFVELGMFWDALKFLLSITDNDSDKFFEIMDMFPQFIRPNIMKIFKYLKRKKSSGICKKIMIYTNNQGPKIWAELISQYFNKQMKTKFFDQIIAAFKVQGKIVEVGRTSHDKSVSDLLQCTKLPRGTEICFLDDLYHPLMEDEAVYYINLKPYTHSMKFSDMAEKYYNKNKSNIPMEKDIFVRKVEQFMKRYDYDVELKTPEENHVDKIVGEQIIEHLKDFFKSSQNNNHTQKNHDKYKKRKTRKK